ncbi:MAG: GIY-YIG nuclease family protein [Acidobacteria bacterium]|nr:GIY-YIG nuclease family protein [Acidobacteriota bacterium]
MKFYYIYLITNFHNTTFYTGVTSNLNKRIHEHKTGKSDSAFTKKYKLIKLVYFEEHRDITTAIQREKTIKRWPRNWKIDLIDEMNPEWSDLASDWYE